jgi:hypothetical protein
VRSVAKRKNPELPFRKVNGDVIWTISDGEEVRMTWEEFIKMTRMEEWIAMPRKEFEKWYKRMRCPKDVREYNQERERLNPRRRISVPISDRRYPAGYRRSPAGEPRRHPDTPRRYNSTG